VTSVYSNGPARNFVRNPFERLAASSHSLWLAAPYFTGVDSILVAAQAGKPIRLLVGLNATTSPEALAKVCRFPSVAARYLTHRFHAKIYIFDGGVLLGSSNLTDAGMVANREATVLLDPSEDAERIEDVRALFAELWDAARVLTSDTLKLFKRERDALRTGPDPDSLIEKAIGRAEPANINVASRAQSRERLFLEGLRRLVYEQYKPAFSDVGELLAEHGLRRPELSAVGLANETNRFLSWLRLTHIPGEEWRDAPALSREDRSARILEFGGEWAEAANNRVPADYVEWLNRVRTVFESATSIGAASQAELTNGLMSLHAFSEQLRFVKGGLAKLPVEFWSANRNDVRKVKRTLAHLTHGVGEFVERLHDVLYTPSFKLSYFGQFSALELEGTLKPEECPPMNGRMAVALRFLGFVVGGV